LEGKVDRLVVDLLGEEEVYKEAYRYWLACRLITQPTWGALAKRRISFEWLYEIHKLR
jgi:hypothetical protein